MEKFVEGMEFPPGKVDIFGYHKPRKGDFPPAGFHLVPVEPEPGVLEDPADHAGKIGGLGEIKVPAGKEHVIGVAGIADFLGKPLPVLVQEVKTLTVFQNPLVCPAEDHIGYRRRGDGPWGRRSS